MRSRTQAREAALKGLYQLDLRSSVPDNEIEDLLGRECAQRDAQDYARILIKGTRNKLEEIDREIREVAENWDLARMAAIDRNVLRMAIYELGNREDIPPAVAINEAVTIAKKYSTKDSGGFVNGILDQVKNRLAARGALPAARPGRAEAAEAPQAEGEVESVAASDEPE
jgi:transcription antitermination factor NusB